MFVQIDPETSLEINYLGQFEPTTSLELAKGQMVVAAERSELLAHAKMIEIVVGAIDEWEFETRLDVSPLEALQLARLLREIASPATSASPGVPANQLRVDRHE